MKIVMIGTGNVAVVLSKKLKAAGHSILQVYGRNHASATALAAELGAIACSSWNAIVQEADLYIIALSDNVFADHKVHVKLTNQLVVHTAGSVSMEVLKNISSVYGVLYPYQTIRKEINPIHVIPLLVDASSGDAKEKLVSLAKTISSKVSVADDLQRMQYHLCAVMTNNFSNYLYVLAEDYCKKNGLDFTNLLPLIDEAASRLHHFSPRLVQTGPAARKDKGTIRQHLNMLNEEPALKNLYTIFTDEMLQYSW